MTITDQLSTAVESLRGARAADRLCEMCVELIAVDAAAISLIFDGENRGNLGVSSRAARRYDELQFTLGEGPCLDAVAGGAPILVSDLREVDRSRWPQYLPAMLDLEVRGVYALPVFLAGQYVGALDLFRHQAGPLTPEQLAAAVSAAELAQLPLLDVLADGVRASSRGPDSSAWQELNELTRVEVSQATGMIVGQLDVDPATALVLLRAHAYATGASPTEVARLILDRHLYLRL